MTAKQKSKACWLSRAGYIRYSIIAEYGLTENDKKRALKLIDMSPENTKQQAEEILNSIADNSEKRYIELLKLYEDVRSEIENVIAEIDDYECRGLLISHYLDGQDWKKIARVFRYSLRTIQYRHIKALDMLDI